MICRYCGTNLPEGTAYCFNCGAIQEVAQPTQPQPTQPQPTGTFEQGGYYEQQPYAFNNMQPPKKKKSILPLILILAGVALVAVVAVVCIFMLGGKEETVDPNRFYNKINMNNMGDFTYDDTSLYFYGNFNEDDEEPSIYSTDHNSANKKLISSDIDVNYIYAHGGKLYYAEAIELGDDEYTYNIGVINTDGSGKTTIISGLDFVDGFEIYGSYIYYAEELDEDSDGYELNICKLDGSDNRRLISYVEAFAIDRGTVYYSANDIIYKYDTSSGNTSELCRAENARDFAIKDEELFYTHSDGISKTDINTGVTFHLVSDDMARMYVVCGEKLYYVSMYSFDEIEEIAEFLAEGDDDLEMIYAISLVGVGDIYESSIWGGGATEIEGDNTIGYALYTSNNELYMKPLLVSNEFEIIRTAK